MASSNFHDFFVNFLILALVIFAAISFIIQFQSENNVQDKIIDNSLINDTYSNLDEDLGDLRDQAQAQKTLFERETPTVTSGVLLLYSIISAGKVFNAMIIGLFNELIKLPVVLLGVDPIIIGVLSTILIFSIIIYLWILYKVGS